MTDAPAEPNAGTAGPADMVEIFYAPTEVFAHRRAGQWGLAYLVLVIVGVGLFFATRNLMQPAIDADISRSFAQAAARAGTTVDKIPGAGMAKTMGSVSLILYLVIAPFIIAALLWVVGKLAGVPKIGTTALMIAVFSMFPRLIGMIVGGIEAAVLPDTALTSTSALSVSPARFIDPGHASGLMALMLRFDVFLLWGVVLTAIGVRVAAGGTRRQAWMTAIGVWVIATLPSLWAAIRT